MGSLKCTRAIHYLSDSTYILSFITKGFRASLSQFGSGLPIVLSEMSFGVVQLWKDGL